MSVCIVAVNLDWLAESREGQICRAFANCSCTFRAVNTRFELAYSHITELLLHSSATIHTRAFPSSQAQICPPQAYLPFYVLYLIYGLLHITRQWTTLLPRLRVP